MSLFQNILDSISHPDRAGDHQDLHGLLSLAQLIPGIGDAEKHIQPILDVLGPHLQDTLNEQKENQGPEAAQQSVQQLAQSNADVETLRNFFGADRFDSIVQEISQRTGLNSELILGALPFVIPQLMKLLNTGAHQTDPSAENPVLNHFLSNPNGGAMLTEAFNLAGRFLKR